MSGSGQGRIAGQPRSEQKKAAAAVKGMPCQENKYGSGMKQDQHWTFAKDISKTAMTTMMIIIMLLTMLVMVTMLVMLMVMIKVMNRKRRRTMPMPMR